MNNNNTVQVLNEIYQSSKTAMDAISILISKSHSATFRASLENQFTEYRHIADDALEQLHTLGELPDDINVFTKLGMWSAVEMSTVTNQRTDHMAEIMINGSTYGIIDMTRYVNAKDSVSPEASALASRLIQTEQNNIEIMKRYL